MALGLKLENGTGVGAGVGAGPVGTGSGRGGVAVPRGNAILGNRMMPSSPSISRSLPRSKIDSSSRNVGTGVAGIGAIGVGSGERRLNGERAVAILAMTTPLARPDPRCRRRGTRNGRPAQGREHGGRQCT